MKGGQIRSVCNNPDGKNIASFHPFAVVELNSFQKADPTSKSEVVQWVCLQERGQTGKFSEA